MPVINDTVNTGSVRITGTATQTWATHFINSNASNIKNIGTNNSVKQITSNSVGGATNGTIQLQLASGNILDLTGNRLLILGNAPRPVDANGTPTTTQVSNSYIDISDGTVLELQGGGNISEHTVPMRGNGTSKIMNNNGLIFWNSVQPSVGLDGTQIVCAPNAGGGDAHFGYNPNAYVKNVKIEFLQTGNNQMIFAAQAIWGTDRPKAQDGIVITSTKGMTNISLFSWNQLAMPWQAGGNNFFMVYRDMGFNVGFNSKPDAIKRSFRRAGFVTPGVTSYWLNQGQMSCAYVHVDPYTTLNSSGVVTDTKTYIRKIEYINVGTTSTDNNAWDVVAFRYAPTITDALGVALQNANVKVTCTSASVISGTSYGLQKSPIAVIGYTGSNGKFLINEPTTPNYNTNVDYYTDSGVFKTHAPSGKFHKFWEANTKYIITNDSRGTIGFDIGAVYGANDYSVEIRKSGYILYTSNLVVDGPITSITSLNVDNNYNSSVNTTGITVSYSNGVTTVNFASGTYNLDQIYKAIIDFHFTTANLESGTILPVTQNTGALTFGNALTLNLNSTHTINAGEKVTSINTTQNISFNGSGQATATFIYTNSLGTSTIWEFGSVAEPVLAGTSLAIYDNAGNTKYYNAVTTDGVYRYYIPPQATGATYTYAIEKYGTKRESGTFPSNAGGILGYAPSYGEDVGITETNLATVQAYTTITNSEQFFDYTAVYRLSEPGIKRGNIVNRDGTNINITGFNHVIKNDATSIYSITGDTITTKGASYEGTAKYEKEVTDFSHTIEADTTEIITILIEDANGDSSAFLQGTANDLVEVWKIPNSTLPKDFETGVLLDTGIGNGAYRFLSEDGFQLVFNNTDLGIVFRYCSMSKGDYRLGWYIYNEATGGLTDEQSLLLNNIYDKEVIIQNKLDADLDVKVSTRLADADYIDPATPQQIWEYTTRTLTSAGSGGATLAEIEASTVLAMKADVTAVETKVDTKPTLAEMEANTNNLAKQDTVNNVVSALSSLENTVNSLAGTDFDGMTDSLDAISTKVDTIQTTVNALENYDDTILEGKVDDIKTKVLTLENYNDTTAQVKLDAIKAKTDVLENADLTGIATAQNITDAQTAIETKIDNIVVDNEAIANEVWNQEPERLKNVSTVQTTGEQLASFNNA